MTTSIQIFKPGKHKCMSGEVIEFSAEMLAATAAAYNPDLHEAPLVVGHPKLNAPAYGWAKAVSFSDGLLTIDPHQVDPDFAQMVNSGKFKKRSASFFSPDSPHNPVPGVYYLRHIGFLGAVPPAVQGLKDASFADSDEGVIEFADWDQMTIAAMFRRVREFVIAKFGQEEADKVLPDYEINSLQINAVQDDRQSHASFSQTEGDDMSPEEKAKLQQFDALSAENATLKAENATLKTQTADFAQRELTAKRAQAHQDNVSFAEGLVKEGKLLPAQKDKTIALMDNLAAQDTNVEFGQEADKQSKTALEIYREQLQAAPKQVEFSEVAKQRSGEAVTVDFAAPSGMAVDAERLELHQKAVAYAKAHNVDYETALSAVK